ncbi:MAG: hypothetical protein OHK0022_52990 [Roseiflexaceae bacterium]
MVTRAETQAGGLLTQLRQQGAEPLVCPAIAFAPPHDQGPLDEALGRLADYDWLIVTSANTVRALFERADALGLPLAQLRGHNGRVKVGAIGSATTRALAEQDVQVRFTPSAFVAETALAEIGDMSGQRVLLPQADIARPDLADGLRAKGALVDAIVAYRTVPGEGAPELIGLLRAGAVDAVTFTSSSTVRYLLDGLEATGLPRDEARALLRATAVFCIGPITSGTARDEGLHVDAEAAEYTSEGLVRALVEWFSQIRNT